jgi:hypothetical protein
MARKETDDCLTKLTGELQLPLLLRDGVSARGMAGCHKKAAWQEIDSPLPPLKRPKEIRAAYRDKSYKKNNGQGAHSDSCARV